MLDAVPRSLRPTAVRLLLGLLVLTVPDTGLGIGDVSFLPVDDYSQRWSLAVTGRTQTSAYTNKDLHSDFIPLITYSGETVFLAGTKVGLHLINQEDWRLNLYVAYRFAGYSDDEDENDNNDPDNLNNMSRDNAVDTGFDISRITSLGTFTFDAASDISSKHNGQILTLSWSRHYEHGIWKVLPWVGMTWYSTDYNRYYYGVEANEATAQHPAYESDRSISLRLGSDIRYQIDQTQYLTFNIEYERLGDAVYDSPIVDDRHILKLGLNYRLEFSDETIEPTARGYDFLESRRRPWFYRVAGGFQTDVKLNEIVRGNIMYEPSNPALLSFFAGKQLTRTFLGSNWEVWAKAGIARRFERGYQDDFFEYVGAIKFYYSNFPWSDKVLTRFGFAEGFSYVEEIPFLEAENLEKKNPKTSHLLNYLDVSIDASLGDIFDTPAIKHCFAGFSVHHRSGIFASADLFGPVDGGSNMNTLYLECLYN